jgi:hypothetical protein
MKETTERPKRTFFISSQVRLLIGFTLLFTIVFAGAYYWFYTYTTDTSIKRIEQDLLDTLKGAAAGVDADQFLALSQEGVVRADGYTDDPRYWAHVDWLVKVNEIEPRAILYTYIAGAQPKEVIFIGSIGAVTSSPSGDPPPWGAKFQEHYISSGKASANLITGLDHFGATTIIYKDEWGSWISGWGPIVNSKGEKVGAIGIDFRADYVKEVQQGIINSMVVAFAITYAILFALVYIISLFFTRPIVALTRAAERIGEGRYDQDLSTLKGGRFRTEFSLLANVFEMMVEKVRQREQNLIHQVEELKIQIDEAKAQQQIGEIVDSEFFQSLREKAKKMRDERKS